MKRMLFTILFLSIFFLTSCDFNSDKSFDKSLHDDSLMKGTSDLASIYEEKGTFYSLQEAYDNGLLTVDNLKVVANYNNNPDFKTLGSFPEENDVLETLAYINQINRLTPIDFKAYKISKYLGNYNDSIVVRTLCDCQYPSVVHEEI